MFNRLRYGPGGAARPRAFGLRPQKAPDSGAGAFIYALVNCLFTLPVGKSRQATVNGREFRAIRPRLRQSLQLTVHTLDRVGPTGCPDDQGVFPRLKEFKP